MRDWSERDRREAAKTPQAWTTNPGNVAREDLFNAIDLLGRQLAEQDLLFRPEIRARLTEIRSLAATLIPKKPRFVCGFRYGSVHVCQVGFGSESARAEHRELVHGLPSDRVG